MSTPTVVLYARWSAETHDALRLVAAMAALPMRAVLEATVAKAAGIDHPLDTHVTKAWARYRQANRLTEGHPST